MRPLRLAVATRCLNRPLKPALVLAGELGATGVQLDSRNEIKPGELSATGRRELLHRIEDTQLSIASLDFPLRSGLCDPDHLDARLAALKQVMEFASQLRCRTVTVKLGGLPPESDSAGTDLTVAVLNDLAAQGNHFGVTLALGPGSEPAPRLLEVLRKVVAGPIGINFDPAAVATSGGSPTDVAAECSTFVSHVMVRDGIRDWDGSVQEVPVGRGQVSWDELLAALSELDYRGWLCVDRTQGEDRPGDAARAIEFIRSVYLG